MTRLVRSDVRRAVMLGAVLLLVVVTGSLLGADAGAQGSGPAGGGSSSSPTFGTYGIGPADIDHFECYSATNSGPASSTALFSIPPVVELSNQFSPGFVAKVGSLVYHCNPTQKTVGGVTSPIVNPNTHLTCFSLPDVSGQPPYTVTITNQFGTGTLTTGQPKDLCLPTWKNLTTATALSQPPGLDHYVCYSVASATNMPKAPTGVVLQDQFGSMTVNVGTPNLLCVPSLKSPVSPLVGALPSTLVHPEAHLVCYPVSKATTQTNPATVTDQNQFGVGTVKISPVKELCVPSYKTVSPDSNTLVITKVEVDPGSGVAIPLSGATFSATPSNPANPSGTCTTNASGTCQINGLATDTYTVTETTAPAGFSPGANQTATFATTPQTLGLTFTDTPSSTADNTLTITKLVNPNSPSGGGTPLPGATFTAVGSLPTSPTGTCTTDASGSCTMTGLANDTYTVSETVPPPGYSPAPPQTVTFPPSPQSLTFLDNPAPTGPTNTLTITKVGVNSSGKVVNLGGATFTATPSNPANPSGTCTTTLPKGTCSITGLALDTYTITETVAPSGYLAGSPQTVTFTMAPQTLTAKVTDTLPAGD